MKPLGLGKIQRQVTGKNAVPKFSLGFGSDFTGLGQLLNVIGARDHRVVKDLNGTDLPHVRNDLCILRVVLVPPDIVVPFADGRARSRSIRAWSNRSAMMTRAKSCGCAGRRDRRIALPALPGPRDAYKRRRAQIFLGRLMDNPHRDR